MIGMLTVAAAWGFAQSWGSILVQTIKGLLSTKIGQACAFAFALWAGVIVYGHYQQHMGVAIERARQGTADAKIARHAAASVSNPGSRRVLDPTTAN